MQRTKQDISALIERGETFHLECKRAQGGLPGSLWESYSAFCNTDGGISDCRNKELQKMFQFLGYSEKAGSGFPKIFMGTDEQHWARPTIREDFELDQTYLNMPTVDLSSASADVRPSSTSVTSVLTSVDISERQWKILTALAEKECSATELLKVVGMDDRVNLVQRYIKPLIKKDVVGMTAAPNSPQQKYKLLPNGSKLIREMETSRSNGGNDISS